MSFVANSALVASGFYAGRVSLAAIFAVIMTSNPTTKSIAITTAISFSIAVLHPDRRGSTRQSLASIRSVPGKALGLLDLYVTDTTHTSSIAQTDDYVTHDIEIPLSPFESMEFKYHLAAGAGMVLQLGRVGRGFVRLSRRSRRRRAGRGEFL